MKNLDEILLGKDEEEFKSHFAAGKFWGLSASFDAINCNKQLIRDAGMIKLFVVRLCDQIEMKRFGDCNVVHFGEDEKVAGYSFTQLIETSLISGHFSNKTNNAYIDIFSCKFYHPSKAAEFIVNFFEAEKVFVNVCIRE